MVFRLDLTLNFFRHLSSNQAPFFIVYPLWTIIKCCIFILISPVYKTHTKIISRADARTKNIIYDLDILSSYDPTKVCIHDMKLNLIQNTFIHFPFPVRSLLVLWAITLGDTKRASNGIRCFMNTKRFLIIHS